MNNTFTLEAQPQPQSEAADTNAYYFFMALAALEGTPK